MRVGIVNDLRIASEALRRIVGDIEGFTVAWIAVDGEHAVAQYRTDPPDIVLMDLVMPGIDGADTSAQIMAVRPCAILVVTASVLANRELVFRAMGAGALDAVTTPDLQNPASLAEFRRKLISVSRLVGAKKPPAARPSLPSQAHRGVIAHRHGRVPIIAIGASTGGPQALATILRKLPGDLGAAVVIVQHLDLQFVPGLARWLAQECVIPLHLARENELLRPGTVYLAETSDHLVVTRGHDGQPHLHYIIAPEDTPHRPSADVFFRSLAALRNGACAAALLTGMGRDGAEGLLQLRGAGAETYAQDQESSVVYGMPRAALELGAVDAGLPLDAIANALVRFAEEHSSSKPANPGTVQFDARRPRG